MARFKRPGADQEALHRIGEKLAAAIGVPIEHVRFATYNYHDGSQWTLVARWEKSSGESWEQVDASDMPGGLGH